MKKGRAFCSDTASQATSNKTEGLLRNKSSTSSIPKDLRKELEEWRDNDEFSYWYPLCDNFPNIDSIVKLEPRSATGKKGGVAYLQITIADTHSIDGKQLENLKEIFDVDDADPPIYIVLCPDLESSKKLTLTTRADVYVSWMLDDNEVATDVFSNVRQNNRKDNPQKPVNVALSRS